MPEGELRVPRPGAPPLARAGNSPEVQQTPPSVEILERGGLPRRGRAF